MAGPYKVTVSPEALVEVHAARDQRIDEIARRRADDVEPALGHSHLDAPFDRLRRGDRRGEGSEAGTAASRAAGRE